MVKQSNRINVNKSEYNKFLLVSKNFSAASQIASEYEYYNAAAILIVHAAISLADALTIKKSGQKSKGENHYEVISLIKEIVGDSEDKTKALNHLEAIISHKNSVAYAGDVYNKSDIEKLKKHYERFSTWAKSILNS